MKRARKVVSILVTLAMLIGLLIPAAGPAAAATDVYTTLKAPAVDDDTVAELGTVFAHFTAGQLKHGDSVTFRLPSDFIWLNETSTDTAMTSGDWNKESVVGSAYQYGSAHNYVEVPFKYAGDNNGLAASGMLKFTQVSDKEVKMEVTGYPSAGDDCYFYLYAGRVWVDGGYTGEVPVVFEAPSTSGFARGSVPIGTVSGGAVNITASSVDSFSDRDQVKIRITEDRAGALSDDSESLKFKLPNGFVWSNIASVDVIWGDSRLDLATLTDGKVDKSTGNGELEIDKDELTLNLPAGFATTEATSIEIAVDVVVDDETKAKHGEVIAKISGDTDATPSELKVGNYGEYDSSIECKDAPTVFAGMDEQVIGDIEINESIAGSIIDGRTLTLELPDGAKWGKLDSDDDQGLHIDPVSFPGTDGKTVKFEFTGESTNDPAQLKLEDMEVVLEPGFTGDLKVKVGGTAGLTGELVVAKVVTPVTITADSTPELKIGASAQAGDLTIAETEAGAIKDGEYLKIDLPQGVRFASTPKVEVIEGDLTIDEGSVKTEKDGEEDDNVVSFKIDSDSTTPSKIKVTGIKYNVDRTVPEGDIVVKVKGDAVAEVNDQTEVQDYYDIDTAGVVTIDGIEAFSVDTTGDDAYKLFPRTSTAAQTVNAKVVTPAPAAGSVTFNIGSNVYVANGATKVMDVAPYIKDGRTYVPVKYLALALGVSEDNIKYENGVVTLVKGDVTLKLTIGDKNLDNNGTITTMDVAPEIVNGRTMLPARFVAEGFGAMVGYTNGQVVISY